MSHGATPLGMPTVGPLQAVAPNPLRLVLNWGRRYSLWVFNFGLAEDGSFAYGGWITYGILLGDPIQVVTNTVTGAAGACRAALVSASCTTR